MDYEFKVIENDQNNNIIFLKENKDTLIRLINQCFNQKYTKYNEIQYLDMGDMFLCYYDAKIIGIALGYRVEPEKLNYNVMVTENPVNAYDSRYIYNYDYEDDDDEDDEDDDDEQEDEKEGGENYKTTRDTKIHPVSLGVYGKPLKYHRDIDVNPVIFSLCKDMGYKKVGRFLLENIEKYYRGLGIQRLYLYAESTKHREQLLRAHNDAVTKRDDDKLNDIREKYKKDQERLIKYYQEMGFKIYENHYLLEYLPIGPTQFYQNVMFLNILYKDIQN